MRITRRQLTQIIREELLREVDSTQGTTDYARDTADVGVPPGRDPLIKALKWASMRGHKGLVTTAGNGAAGVELFRAVGDAGQHFKSTEEIDYEIFLTRYIKPERKSAYENAFKQLASKDMKNHIRVPLNDMVPGTGSGYSLMGIAERTGAGDDIIIKKVIDRRFYTVDEVYSFIKTLGNASIMIYDVTDSVVDDYEDAGRLIYPAPEAENAAAQTRNSEDDTWAASAAKSPLRSGATGPNVKKAQDLLVKELKKMSSTAMAPVGTALIALQNLLAQKKIEGDKNNPPALTKSLAEKIDASGPDGKFGPMTKVAVQVFQQQARLIPVDGVIGKDTANALIHGTEKESLVNQAEQVPATPPTAADVENVKESYIINRWNKLAGLLVD